MTLEMFPPAVLVSVRFVLSGGIMLAALKLGGYEMPKGRELRLTAFYGLVLLGGGNGALVYAEQWIPSGLAALIVTTSPFWMVGLEAVLPGGSKIHLPGLAGIAVGFCGVLLLIAPALTGANLSPGFLPAFAVLQLGVFCWCIGSIVQRRQPRRSHPFVTGAIQQLATGIVCAPVALLIPHPPIQTSTRALWALAYLVIFGSIVGYSAYVYAMDHLPVSIVSTYAFVNPLVAVFLGWAFYREPFGVREAAAMAVIFVGVALVKYWSEPVVDNRAKHRSPS